jgi:hypothetical protein
MKGNGNAGGDGVDLGKALAKLEALRTSARVINYRRHRRLRLCSCHHVSAGSVSVLSLLPLHLLTARYRFLADPMLMSGFS